MPRTTIVFQTKQEPGSVKLGTLLEQLITTGAELGLEPLKAHGLAPKPNGQTDVVTVTRHTRTSSAKDIS